MNSDLVAGVIATAFALLIAVAVAVLTKKLLGSRLRSEPVCRSDAYPVLAAHESKVFRRWLIWLPISLGFGYFLFFLISILVGEEVPLEEAVRSAASGGLIMAILVFLGLVVLWLLGRGLVEPWLLGRLVGSKGKNRNSNS